MLRSVNKLIGYDVKASDASVGTIYDVYFWDDTWRVKWIVVDTGTWLPGRKVLIRPEAFGRPHEGRRVLPVDQTRKQIEEAPDYETDPPVAYQEEETGWTRYYRWLPYIAPHGLAAAPLGTGAYALPVATGESAPPEEGAYDAHLRSASTVIGYRIHANDGDFGHVEDFVLDDRDWSLSMFIVDTRNWLPAKKVVLATEWIKRIVWAKEEVEVDLNIATIKDAPAFDPTQPLNQEYAGKLYDHYGRPQSSNRR